MEWILYAGKGALYLAFYFLFGDLFFRLFKKKESFYFEIIIGFFIYYLLFSVCCIPMKLMLQPLSRLCTIWYIVLGSVLSCWVIIVFNSIVKRRKQIKKFRIQFPEDSWKKVFIVIVMLGIVLGQILIMNGNDSTGALWDQAYYVGDVATSVYTDTLSQYDVYSGEKLNHLNTEYLLETYENHSAVMCRLFDEEALIETRTVMGSVVIVLYNLIIYMMGMCLFKNKRGQAVLFVFLIGILNVNSYNIFTAAEFLLFRAFEGKTILAVVIIPVLLYQFMRIVNNNKDKWLWIEMFVIICGSFGLNMSSIYMIPFELSALLIPLAIKERKVSILVKFAVCMLPCVFMSAAYMLTKSHYLFYTS